MKLLFTGIFLLFINFSHAQGCGTWLRKDTTTPWIDVKDYTGSFSDDTMWSLSAWTLTSGTKTSYRSSACPCECYDNYTEIQYRIKPKTGEQQKRIKTVYFEYVPKEKPLYDKIIDSLSK